MSGAGFVVTVGATVALVVDAVPALDLVLLALCVVMLGLVATCALSIAVARIVVGRALRACGEGPPLRLECGFAARTGFEMPRLRWIPFVDLEWSWIGVLAEVNLVRRSDAVAEQVVATRRAVAREVRRRFVLTDVFGLWRVQWTHVQHRDVRATPSPGALRHVDVVRGLAGGSTVSHPDGTSTGDRIDLRPYAKGDPIRLVLWKVFARTRTLVVRTPETAISPSQRVVAWLVTSPHDEPAAGAARAAIDSGALGGDWVLGVDGIDADVRDRARAHDALARSGAHDGEAGAIGLARFLDEHRRVAGGRAVVFVPPAPGPWLDRAVAAAAVAPRQIGFVIATDGIDRATEPRRRRWWQRRPAPRPAATSAVAGRLGASATWSDVTAVARVLGATGASVSLVDRATGRVWDPSRVGAGGAQ
jgi:hypothetical protein